MKRTLIFLLFLMAGLIMGAVLTRVAQQTSFLSWLCWEMQSASATRTQ